MNPSITISEAIQGALSPSDLLTAEGTIAFGIQGISNGALIRVESDAFIFRIGVLDSKLAVQRNNVLITLTPEPMPHPNDLVPVFVMWNYNELTLICGKKESKVATAPAAPPAQLIKFARTQNLLPVKEYDSEDQFRSKVYSCLLSIKDKINEIGSFTVFWDIEYDGHRINARKPKREPEIHRLIHCMLSDQMLLASVEVIPEFQTGVGNLDFLFMAPVKGRDNCRFCLEFKQAHSNDI